MRVHHRDPPPAPRLLPALATLALGLATACWLARFAIGSYVTIKFEQLVEARRLHEEFDAGAISLQALSSLESHLDKSCVPLLACAFAAHLLWLSRALGFARRLGADVPATWRAIGAYFVPLANLYYPARHMRALVASTSLDRVSADPDLRVEQPYRVSARVVPSSGTPRSELIRAWWCAWCLGVAAHVATRVVVDGSTMGSTSLDLARLGYRLFTVSIIVALVLTIVLVRRTASAQRAQRAAIDATEQARVELELRLADRPTPIPRRRVSRPPSVFVELEHEMAARDAARRARREKKRARTAAKTPTAGAT